MGLLPRRDGFTTLSNTKQVAEFGGFQLDLSSGELRRQGVLVKLQPQPAKVLVLLVTRDGEIVTRSEIAEQVWGSQTFVDFEHGLNFAIRQIRTALDDDADAPRFLETLPKRGYRFKAPLDEATGQPPATAFEDPSKARDVGQQIKKTEPTRRRIPLAFVSIVTALLLAVIFLAWRSIR